ncbi:MAG: carboxy terminal-processing peptidase [Planctomycetes bacterium]|nr:carboxy terminal-processing peptidase [Planctomycetota bacterium]
MANYRTARRLFCFALGLALSCLWVPLVHAQLSGPSENDSKVARAVTDALETVHLSRHKVDDEVSHRFLQNFIKEFDSTKVFFEQRDMDEFNQHDTLLDDEVKRGDLGFAYQVWQRFIQRLRERLPLVEELVRAEHDFTIDEYLPTDYDQVDFPRNAEEVRDRWRKKIKYDLLVQRLDKKPLPPAEQKEKIVRRYRNLLHRMQDQLSSDELLEMYLNALSASFDPHTQYMSPATLEDFNISMRLHLDGIGARLRSEDGYTIVAEVLPGGAADLDGRLKVEDKIVGVAEEGEKIADVVDMNLSDVVKRISGKRGTTVVMRVLPAGKTEPSDYSLKRAKIELTSSEARGELIPVESEAGGRPYRIGYIDLPSFYMDVAEANKGNDNYKSSTRDVRKLLEEFQKQGRIDAVVLDLRNNGGGALSEAISLTDLFIDRGPVVQVKDSRSKVDPYEAEERGMAYSGPLVVLVSKLSASASEILAGAIQDYGRGLIVGDSSTHGKGTVQTVIDIGRQFGFPGRTPQLGALKITIQQFYRVNGDSTQSKGVASDVVLPSKWDHLDIGEAHMPQALPSGHVDPLQHENKGWVSEDLRHRVQSLSDRRRESSTDFQKLAEDITRLEALRQRKAVSLNEQRRREETGRGLTEDEDGIPDPEKPRKKDAPVFDRTFYNMEVLAITQDFLRLGSHPRVSSNL